MDRKLFLLFGIIGVLLISGCTQLICEPDYVKPAGGEIMLFNQDESWCKTLCYEKYEVTSFKIENDTRSLLGIETTIPTCYCDINNCNPRKDI